MTINLEQKFRKRVLWFGCGGWQITLRNRGVCGTEGAENSCAVVHHSQQMANCGSLFELAFWGEGWNNVIRQRTHTLIPCHESFFTIDYTLKTTWNPCRFLQASHGRLTGYCKTFLDDEWFQLILSSQGYHLAKLIITLPRPPPRFPLQNQCIPPLNLVGTTLHSCVWHALH